MSVSRHIAAPVLGFIAIVQAVRFAQAWPVTVNGFDVPVWASAVVALVFGMLAVLVWREGGPPRA
jgi:hypothetical protein